MNIQFTKAIVIRDGGPDKVSVYTNLPSPLSGEFLVLKFEALSGTGDAYVLDNFGLTSQIIDVNSRSFGLNV